MDQGEIVPIVSIVGAFSIAAFFWWLIVRAGMRERELLHVERMAAIEKGLPPPDEPAKAGGAACLPAQDGGKGTKASALGTGIFWLCIGIGLILTMLVVYPASTHWGWGILVVALGLAYLVGGYWLMRGKAETHANTDAAGRDAGSH